VSSRGSRRCYTRSSWILCDNKPLVGSSSVLVKSSRHVTYSSSAPYPLYVASQPSLATGLNKSVTDGARSSSSSNHVEMTSVMSALSDPVFSSSFLSNLRFGLAAAVSSSLANCSNGNTTLGSLVQTGLSAPILPGQNCSSLRDLIADSAVRDCFLNKTRNLARFGFVNEIFKTLPTVCCPFGRSNVSGEYATDVIKYIS
jgi:hypothetical protein